MTISKTEKIQRQEISGKVISLLGELSTNPRTGTGKPEQLKGKNVETWVSAKSDYIVTGNKKHFKMSEIPVKDAGEFLKEYWEG